jgi:DNA-binding MltR family transcriptional regulator
MTTPPKISSVKDQLESLNPLIEKIGRQTHAGATMLLAAALDRLLEEALTTKMVELNREMRDKLFGEYGTLRDFSAKIDIAFSLGLVDRQNYKLLTAIRKCRNLFAHSRGFLSFESPDIRALLLESGATMPTTASSIEDFISLGEMVETHVAQAAGIHFSETLSKLKAEL